MITPNEYAILFESFNNRFHAFHHNVSDDWYSTGIALVLNTDSIAIKEDVLNKMLFIYPNNYELYYYMGCIYKHSRPYQALSWFRTCYRLDPNNVENLLDYIQTLFNLNMISYIVKWDADNNHVLQNATDLRVQFIYATIRIKQGDLQYSLQTYNHIMANIDRLPISNVIFVYLNYAYLLSKIGYLKEAFWNYTHVILPWLKTHESDDFLQSPDSKVAVKALYENYIVMFDYIYHNFSDRYLLCRDISNKLYKCTHMYTHEYRDCLSLNTLRIGYVSSDFEAHAVSNFILPIIMNHSDLFVVHLFSQKEINTSKFDKRIVIHNIQFMSDDDCAKLIYEENIDILFDLNGYTDGNRLGVFSRCPSPIQVSYLGYPNSLSVDFIQYRITDAIADNDSSKQIYTETRIYLPKCFLLFKSVIQSAPVYGPPKDQGNPVLFGALNKELKNSTSALNAWSCILSRVPNSKILIKIDSNDMYESRLAHYSDALKVDASRIQIICKCSDEEYIGLFGRIDILLDTFPYSGTTTTCNALYNSVPMVSLYNKDYHCNNVSSSLLIHSGLGDFVAYSPNDYIDKAVQLAQQKECSGNSYSYIREGFEKRMHIETFMNMYETTLTNLYKHHWSNASSPNNNNEY